MARCAVCSSGSDPAAQLAVCATGASEHYIPTHDIIQAVMGVLEGELEYKEGCPCISGQGAGALPQGHRGISTSPSPAAVKRGSKPSSGSSAPAAKQGLQRSNQLAQPTSAWCKVEDKASGQVYWWNKQTGGRVHANDQPSEDEQWIARYVEENGLFTVNIHNNRILPDKGKGGGEQFVPDLSVKLSMTSTRPHDSTNPLYRLKEFFRCGWVRKNGKCYRVRSVRDLRHRIVPFFEAHGFLSQRQQSNFERLREVLEIMAEREHLREKGFERVEGLVAEFEKKV